MTSMIYRQVVGQVKLFAALTLTCVGAHSSAAATIPIHAYELNSSLDDTFGGPALVNNGATLGAGGLTFGANQGPSLSNWLAGSATAGNYSIEMFFKISNTGGYRKLLDYNNRTNDNGFYNDGTRFVLYYGNPLTGPNNTITANTMTHVVVTRDGASNALVGYVNGSAAQGVSYSDVSSLLTFSGPGNIAHFLRDDTVTGGDESSAGFVDFIRIYDRPVSALEAGELYANRNVPEPASAALLALGGVGLVLLRRRR